MTTYTKEQLERRNKSGWVYDAKGRPAKAILSFSQAMSLVNKYGRRGLTDDQREAIAQYMIDHDTALVKAEAAVLGCEEIPVEQLKNRYVEIWLTR